MSTTRLTVATVCAAAAIAVCAQAAQAAPPRWEFKGPPTAYTQLASETGTAKATLTLTKSVAPFTVYGKCKTTGTENFTNPSNLTLPGEDEVTSFAGSCTGGPPPCIPAKEKVSIVGVAPNSTSELLEIAAVPYDEFSGVEIEFKCLSSGLHGVAEEIIVNPLKPEVLVNKLVFAGAASGELEIGITKFDLTGTDKLKPTISKKVKA